MNSQVATLENVRLAVATLQQRGDKASADNVISLIGGSKSTVLSHLRTLRSEQDVLDDLPVSVLDMSRPFLRNVFEAGRTAEADKTAKATQRLSTVIADLDAEVLALIQENSELETRNTRLLDQDSTREFELKELRSRVSQLLDENDQLKKQVAEVRESSAVKLNSALDRLQHLVGGNGDERNQNGHHRPILQLRRKRGQHSSNDQNSQS